MISMLKKTFPFILGAALCASAATAQSVTGSLEVTSPHYESTGGTISISVSVDYTGLELSTLGLDILLPSGFTYVGSSAATSADTVPQATPTNPTTGTAEFAYITSPASVASFKVALEYASGLTGDQLLSGNIYYTIQGESSIQTVAFTSVTLVNSADVPVINIQPASVSVQAGENASFSVTATSNYPQTYQWYFGDQAISGATASSYSLSGVSSASGGSYSVVISNAAGSVTSAAGVLSVLELPKFSGTLVAQSVGEGVDVTFTESVSGSTPISYQWYKDGNALTGQNSATLSLASVTPADSGSYSLIATNSVGSRTAGPAVLTVNYRPIFTTSPQSQTVLAGETITLGATIDAVPAPNTYYWTKDGLIIEGATSATLVLNNVSLADAGDYALVASGDYGFSTSDHATITVNQAPSISQQPTDYSQGAHGNATFSVTAEGHPDLNYQWRKNGVVIAGANGAALSLTDVTIEDDGSQFDVVVSNSIGSVTSSTATLTVNQGPVVTGISFGGTTTAAVGDNVSFSVTVSGNPAPTVQWRKNGVAIPGETDPVIIINSVQVSDAGEYDVVATNEFGSTTSFKQIFAVHYAPSITAQPASQSVAIGGAATFSVSAGGSPAPSYQWRKNGVPLASGGVGTAITLPSVTLADSGSIYDVVVSNSQGQVTSTPAILTVTDTRSAASITVAPVGGSVNVGGSFSFSVTAGGTAPFSYQWHKDGAEIAGATGANLTLTGIALGDAGSYAVVVTNEVSSIVTVGVQLDVVPRLAAPTIRTQPRDVSVKLGSIANLSVVASGSPEPSYQWRKNGTAINGATASTMALNNVQFTAAGSYDVVVTNSQGAVTSSRVRVTVSATDTVPTITSQPRDAISALGRDVSFSVTATGVPEPVYQWLKNGVPIAGATATTLGLPAITTDAAGAYSVAVTNAEGAVTSRSAMLKVLLASYQGTYFGSFGPGRGTFAIVVEADNTGFFLGFDEIANLYVSGTVTVADDGSFTL
ncbi:immunoglobulin domain-containing protein, partial [Synoicihabitans lomoniglobus]|uniref:immunoglobulin domain-containing protein n=1 Tax=Synoicihabitans lomoniglobus TaxID=2909285 RepID=UPI002ED4E9CB|nr:immunoglobulin domain-containing protein [Opitutaceae bacterium LMO-M01]